MAYNNAFPTYPPLYQPYPQQYPQQFPQQAQIQQQISANAQPQNAQPIPNGLISIPSEADARNFPVGYGQSVSFKDENAPYLYTKTMGFSQLEPPKFEKYKLIKESAETPAKPLENESTDKLPSYAEKGEIEDVRAEIKAIKEDIAKLKEKKKKKEVIVDDDDE